MKWISPKEGHISKNPNMRSILASVMLHLKRDTKWPVHNNFGFNILTEEILDLAAHSAVSEIDVERIRPSKLAKCFPKYFICNADIALRVDETAPIQAHLPLIELLYPSLQAAARRRWLKKESRGLTLNRLRKG